MNEQLSATIIPFPVRARTVQVDDAVLPAAEPSPPASLTVAQAGNLSHSSDRLNAALASLSAALADQKEATQRWKVAIEDLATKMRTLGELNLGEKKIS